MVIAKHTETIKKKPLP